MCLSPILIKRKDNIHLNASSKFICPCGKCPECRKKYINDWFIRWNEESKNYNPENRYFITLTYSDENLKYVRCDDGSFVSTLNYSDVTLFLKRLRSYQERYCKNNGIQNLIIKYHYCGEYGLKNTKRPHYHLLIFGILPQVAAYISDIWSKGIVDVKNNSDSQTIRYVMKYTLKNVFDNSKDIKKDGKYLYTKNYYTTNDYSVIRTTLSRVVGKVYNFTNRVIEKSFCSKYIGYSYLTDTVKNLMLNFLNDFKYTFFDKYKNKYINMSLPRYYWNKVLYKPLFDSSGKRVYKENGTAVLTPSPTDEDFLKTPAGIKWKDFILRSSAEYNDFVDMFYNKFDDFLEWKRSLKNKNYIEDVKVSKMFSKYENNTINISYL